jgi:hypothetical protein
MSCYYKTVLGRAARAVVVDLKLEIETEGARLDEHSAHPCHHGLDLASSASLRPYPQNIIAEDDCGAYMHANVGYATACRFLSVRRSRFKVECELAENQD